MRLADYSPPTDPTYQQQRDALQKGLGRAMQWAKANKLNAELLLEACLHNWCYDRQCEGSRANWLKQLMSMSENVQKFRQPIIDSLSNFPSSYEADQRVKLALYYAQQQDTAFRDRLYQIAGEVHYEDFNYLAAKEIIELDREAGFLHIAKLRGDLLDGRDWDWQDETVIYTAEELFGKDRVQELLQCTTDTGVIKFYTEWLSQQNKKETDKSTPQERHQIRTHKLKDLPADRVISDIIEGTDSLNIMAWGKNAPEAELVKYFDYVISLDNVDKLVRFLHAFSMRKPPRFEPIFLEWCQSDDWLVQVRAYQAISQLTDQRVREFGLHQAQAGIKSRYALSLFTNNYQLGDEDFILANLILSDDLEETHGIFSEMRDYFDINPVALKTELPLLAYFHTPCAICRRDVAKKLIEHQLAPDWLELEYRDDCDAKQYES